MMLNVQTGHKVGIEVEDVHARKTGRCGGDYVSRGSAQDWVITLCIVFVVCLGERSGMNHMIAHRAGRLISGRWLAAIQSILTMWRRIDLGVASQSSWRSA